MAWLINEDDELPPCIGERYRDTLRDIARIPTGEDEADGKEQSV